MTTKLPDVIYVIMYSTVGMIAFFLFVHYIFVLPFKSRLFGKIFSLLLSIMFLSLAFSSWKQLKEIPITPAEMSVNEAARKLSAKDHIWVTLINGEWDCKSFAKAESETVIVYQNKEQSIITVVMGGKACDKMTAMQPSGRMEKISRQRFVYLSNYIDLAKYGKTAALFQICTWCGRTNSQLGVVMGIIMGVLSLFYGKVANDLAPGYLIFEKLLWESISRILRFDHDTS